MKTGKFIIKFWRAEIMSCLIISALHVAMSLIIVAARNYEARPKMESAPSELTMDHNFLEGRNYEGS